ncbi:MAG: hypothetical protein HQ582_01825 [Planctomycetes bacterium]|nr:hypothetical protein [Planctomycetota bacterium]
MSTSLQQIAIVLGFTASALSVQFGEAGERTGPGSVSAVTWDTFSDTWVATDALGRRVPTYEDVGPPRPERFVGIFYFLWHGAHVNGGPYDVTKILAQDPQAMAKNDSPLWGPMHAPHHWSESIFGYYLTDDAGVLRKHAQMLADAGVDTLIFDVTNQITYRPYYTALLRVFSEVRAEGGKTPQVAFLCPFWEPAKVVAELYKDLYAPGLFADLWFRWEGKPLILADPELLGRPVGNTQLDRPAELTAGHTLGQSFTVTEPIGSVAGCFPNWATHGAAMTLTLYSEKPGGKQVVSKRFEDVSDNAWVSLEFDPPLAAGTYCLEMSQPSGTIGWWSHTADVWTSGQALADGKTVAGDRTLRVFLAQRNQTALRRFFTFRAPQPDYFRGPTKADMWSWAEVYPQHVFRNSRGEKEEMAVGVAQNAVGDRVGSMTEPGARGRSFRKGATANEPEAVLHGYNVAEQWERALEEDPGFIFLTGWNEWFAFRLDEFGGRRQPVVFVDQFDQEHSRDIEPMRGGHGDNYYYQMVSYIRRYKGARPLSAATQATIRIDGRFDDWAAIAPEFRDTIGDPMRRNHPGYASAGPYVNTTGRNDITAAKVSWDAEKIYFYVRTQRPLTPQSDPNWMLLFIDVDCTPATGWLGYDFVVNRVPARLRMATLERNQGGYRWGSAKEVGCWMHGSELELAIPWSALGLARRPVGIDFKWADNIQQTGDASDFTLNGDVAPNDRFKYRAKLGAAGEERRP